MKIKRSLTICAVSLGLAGLGMAQDIKFSVPPVPAGQDQSPAPAPAAAPAPEASAATPAAPAYSDLQKAEEFGWFVSQKVGIAGWGFTQEQAEAVGRGVTEALEGRGSPFEIQKIGPEMDQFTRAHELAAVANAKRKNLAENEALFAKLKQDKDIVETPSGLRYKIIQQGTGGTPGPTDTVTVNYEGRLVNGVMFDSSAQHGGKPAEIALSSTIPGWVEGLQKVGKGGKIVLVIPPDLAYGDNNPNLPPSAALVFNIELIDFKPTPPAAPAK
jgi:FKBP-type peptidyl-prolyl cis-trans isomerase